MASVPLINGFYHFEALNFSDLFCLSLDLSQILSWTLAAPNVLHIGPFGMIPKPVYSGERALQKGSKIVENGALLTKLWTNKVYEN